MPGRIALTLTLVFLSLVTKAQTNDPSTVNPRMQVSELSSVQAGEVTIHQDNRLDVLLSRFEKVNRANKGMWGYRIQIYFGSGRSAREDAYKAKANFLSEFSGVPAYVLYQTPFYKVRVGDFRTKREAYILYTQIRKHFRDAYITPPEIIKLPPLNE